MSTLLRSAFVIFALLGAAHSASAYPEHTIHMDMSHSKNTDSGMVDADCDEADCDAK